LDDADGTRPDRPAALPNKPLPKLTISAGVFFSIVFTIGYLPFSPWGQLGRWGDGSAALEVFEVHNINQVPWALISAEGCGVDCP
jgi:hypothetical protein